jgi:hypothetical protein
MLLAFASSSFRCLRIMREVHRHLERRINSNCPEPAPSRTMRARASVSTASEMAERSSCSRFAL